MHLILATFEITAADYNPNTGEFDGSPFIMPQWVQESASAQQFINSAFKRAKLYPHTTGGTDYAQWTMGDDTRDSFGPGDFIDIQVTGGVILRKAGTVDTEAYQVTELYAKAFPEAVEPTYGQLQTTAALLEYALSVILNNHGNIIDTLAAFAKRGDLSVSDVPSKVGLSDLLKYGYVTQNTDDVSVFTPAPKAFLLRQAITNLSKEYRHAKSGK